MNDAPQTQQKWRWLRIFGTAVVCLAILAGSAAAIVVINQTEPTAQQINATRKSAALVETLTVERATYAPRLVVLGTVEPAQDLMLSPQVRGQVIELSPTFVPGGMVPKGGLLLKLDPADFNNALSISESELEQAVASLSIEEGRQSLAKKELALLEDSIGQMNRSLVLREPQIASIRAEVSVAESAVDRAKLDLERTSIFAPFDAQILSRTVNVGSQVAPGDQLARLVGIDEYWIFAAVPVRTLRWIQFPDADEEGSMVTLRNPDAWPPDTERCARVARMIGSLDQQTRLARVLITVPDPLGRESGEPPLILGTLIETEIEGRAIENVVRLERNYVRDQDTVWVMQDEKLEIRETNVVFRDADFAYIREGLESGDEVVTTTLATVAAGVGLRKIEALAEASDSSAGELVD
ncbi:efflux RND transporter periplasmic adaptor subunit [Planctomycetaceae bacterium SH139]